MTTLLNALSPCNWVLILPSNAGTSPLALPFCTAVKVKLRFSSYCNKVMLSAATSCGCRLLSLDLSAKLASGLKRNALSLLVKTVGSTAGATPVVKSVELAAEAAGALLLAAFC